MAQLYKLGRARYLKVGSPSSQIFPSSFSVFDEIQTMSKILGCRGGVSCSRVRVPKEGNPIPRASWIQKAGWWLKLTSSNIWSKDLNEVLNYWIGPNFIKLKSTAKSYCTLPPWECTGIIHLSTILKTLPQIEHCAEMKWHFHIYTPLRKPNENLKEITIRVLYLGKGVNHPNDIAKSYVANV